MNVKEKRFKKNKQGANKKKAREESKVIDKNLNQALKICRSNQIAIIPLKEARYFMMSEKVLNESIQNLMQHGKFQPNISQELINFTEKHQELLFLMNNLQYEKKDASEFDTEQEYEKHCEIIDRNQKIFDELDQFTFDFSEARGQSPEHRKIVLKKYHETLKNYPILDKILKGRNMNCPVVGCVPCSGLNIEQD